MRTDNKAENQHHVPKMLLRLWARQRGKEHVIWTLDKSNAEKDPFPTNIENVGAERRYNEFKQEDGTVVSYEPAMTDLENEATGALGRLRSAKSIRSLSEEDRAWIARFVIGQWLRSSNTRARQRHLFDGMTAIIRSRASEPKKLNLDPLDENGVKQFHLTFLGEQEARLASVLLTSKVWTLWKTNTSAPFYLGDSPVVFFNNRDFGPYGNLGLLVPGVEIYLPLDPTLTLGLLCPTYVAELKEGLALRHRLLARGIDEDTLRQHGGGNTQRLREMVGCIEAGLPFQCNERDLTFYNKVQTGEAERFVFSADGRFDVAQEFLQQDPARRQGPRMKL